MTESVVVKLKGEKANHVLILHFPVVLLILLRYLLLHIPAPAPFLHFHNLLKRKDDQDWLQVERLMMLVLELEVKTVLEVKTFQAVLHLRVHLSGPLVVTLDAVFPDRSETNLGEFVGDASYSSAFGFLLEEVRMCCITVRNAVPGLKHTCCCNMLWKDTLPRIYNRIVFSNISPANK